MGMFDRVEILDDIGALCCPHGHTLRSFQTKGLHDPSMSTYLVWQGQLFLAARSEDHDAGRNEHWRIEGETAIREHRYELREIPAPRVVRVYGQCNVCAPVLLRTDRASLWGDLVIEHHLFVDFRLTFQRSGPLHVERTSGTRADLKDDLRGRGAYVMEDDEPLAVAHREVEQARERRASLRRGRGLRG